MSAKSTLHDVFEAADIKVNGDRPWDIQIHNEGFYSRVMGKGTLGAGESYMDGWWDVEALDVFFTKLMSVDIEKRLRQNPTVIFSVIKSMFVNLQRRSIYKVGEEHYDIGNDLYAKMLDKRLTYTCGYWRNASNLDEAQEHKLDLICRKLNLKKGDKVLDIGSGWGSFLNFAAEKYGAECVGITISKEQAAFANKNRGNLPVETRLQDYMEVDEQFDHIVSIGMFEHVGKKNYRKFFEKSHSLLKDDGLFLLHTIGASKWSKGNGGDPWISKYIFPYGELPSMDRVMTAVDRLYKTEDVHNFGYDYSTTLTAWRDNFEAGWPELKGKYDDRFYRMWQYYLNSFIAVFGVRNNQLWQFVFSKSGVKGGYRSVR